MEWLAPALSCHTDQIHCIGQVCISPAELQPRRGHSASHSMLLQALASHVMLIASDMLFCEDNLHVDLCIWGQNLLARHSNAAAALHKQDKASAKATSRGVAT